MDRHVASARAPVTANPWLRRERRMSCRSPRACRASTLRQSLVSCAVVGCCLASAGPTVAIHIVNGSGFARRPRVEVARLHVSCDLYVPSRSGVAHVRLRPPRTRPACGPGERSVGRRRLTGRFWSGWFLCELIGRRGGGRSRPELAGQVKVQADGRSRRVVSEHVDVSTIECAHALPSWAYCWAKGLGEG